MQKARKKKKKKIVCLPDMPMMLAAANKSGGFSHLISISLSQDRPRHYTLFFFFNDTEATPKKDDVIDITDTLDITDTHSSYVSGQSKFSCWSLMLLCLLLTCDDSWG